MLINPFDHFWNPTTIPEMAFSCGFTIVCGCSALLLIVCLHVIIERIQDNRKASKYERVGVK